MLHLGCILILDEVDKISKQLFELEVVVEVSLGLCFGSEENFEVIPVYHMDQIVHETGVEALLGFNLERCPQQLVVEYLYIGVHVVLEVFQHSVLTHKVILEKLRLGASVVGEDIGGGCCFEVEEVVAVRSQKLVEASLLWCHLRHPESNLNIY